MINDALYAGALKLKGGAVFQCFASAETDFFFFFDLKILLSGVAAYPVRCLVKVEHLYPRRGPWVEFQRRKQVFHGELMKAFHPASLMRD